VNYRIPSLLLMLAMTGCTTTPASTISRPSAYYETIAAEAPPASLFSGDADVLSDEDIAKVLDFRYVPPELSRVALMSFAPDTWSDWSEEMAVASEQMKTSVIDRLVASPFVYDASYLPSILVPEIRTVPRLREAAARYQADLLLVYRSSCRSFESYRAFSADKTRAFCGVEAVLLDTRTGLVPFTSSATRSFEAAQNDSDMNFRETILKAQLNAISDALGDISAEVVAFLASKR